MSDIVNDDLIPTNTMDGEYNFSEDIEVVYGDNKNSPPTNSSPMQIFGEENNFRELDAAIVDRHDQNSLTTNTNPTEICKEENNYSDIDIEVVERDNKNSPPKSSNIILILGEENNFAELDTDVIDRDNQNSLTTNINPREICKEEHSYSDVDIEVVERDNKNSLPTINNPTETCREEHNYSDVEIEVVEKDNENSLTTNNNLTEIFREEDNFSEQNIEAVDRDNKNTPTTNNNPIFSEEYSYSEKDTKVVDKDDKNSLIANNKLTEIFEDEHKLRGLGMDVVDRLKENFPIADNNPTEICRVEHNYSDVDIEDVERNDKDSLTTNNNLTETFREEDNFSEQDIATVDKDNKNTPPTNNNPIFSEEYNYSQKETMFVDKDDKNPLIANSNPTEVFGEEDNCSKQDLKAVDKDNKNLLITNDTIEVFVSKHNLRELDMDIVERNDDNSLIYDKVYEINGQVFREAIPQDNGELSEFEIQTKRTISGEMTTTIQESSDSTLSVSIQETPYGIIINSDVLLSLDHWNTLVVHDNRKKCMVCDTIVDSAEHIKSDVHNDNLKLYQPLKKFDLSITRLIGENYHCGVCNEYFDRNNDNEHFDSKGHEEKMLTATNTASDVMYDFDIHNDNRNRDNENDCYHYDRNRILTDQASGFDTNNDNGNRDNETRNINNENEKTLERNRIISASDTSGFDSDCAEGFYDYDFDIHSNDNIDFSDYTNYDVNEVKQVSYASMAAAATTPELLNVKIYGKDLKIKFNHFHMIIAFKSNQMYCMACKEYGKLTQKGQHCSEEKHLANLQSYKYVQDYTDYFIRQVDHKYYHCGLCNSLQMRHEIDDHIESYHKRNPKVALNSEESAKRNKNNDNNKVKHARNDNEIICNEQLKSYYEQRINAMNHPKTELNQNAMNQHKMDTNQHAMNHHKIDTNQRAMNQNKMDTNQRATNQPINPFEMYLYQRGMIAPKMDVNQSKMELNRNDEINQRRMSAPKMNVVTNQCAINQPINPFEMYLYQRGMIAPKMDVNQSKMELNRNDVMNQRRMSAPKMNINQSKMELNLHGINVDTNQRAINHPTAPLDMYLYQRGMIAPKMDVNQSKMELNRNHEINQRRMSAPKMNMNQSKMELNEHGMNLRELEMNERRMSVPKIHMDQPTKELKEHGMNEPKTDLNQPKKDEQTTEIDDMLDMDESITDNEDDTDYFNEKIVYLKYKNSYIQVGLASYNSLVQIGDGTRYCFVCSLVVKGSGRKHTESKNHTNCLEQCRFVTNYERHFLRQMFLTYHCCICNIIFTRKDINRHITWPQHLQDNKIDKRTRRNNLKAGSKQINIYFKNESIFLNEKEPEIKVLLMLEIKINCNKAENLQKKNKIVIYGGNVLKFSWDVWHSLCKNKNGHRCLLCQADVKNYELSSHIVGEYHKSSLDSFERQYLPALIRKVNESTLNCVICNTEVSNKDHIVSEHVNGKKHKKNYDTILMDSATVQTYTDCNDDVLNL